MLQFKTVALPATELTVKGNNMYTLDTANRALAPVAQAIQNEARGGWNLHSYVVCPALIKRKVGILERLLGWIPIIGFLFRSNKPESISPNYYMLIFSKEA